MKWLWLIPLVVLLGGVAWYGSYRTWNPAMPRSSKGKRHIVCIGDSITYGAGVIPLQRWRSYPAYLQWIMGSGYQVMNFGLSGRTLMTTGDMPYTKESFYAAALRVPQPHYILMLGSNDAREKWWDTERFQRELVQLLTSLQRKGSVTIMLPPKVFPVEKKGEVSFGIRDNLLKEVGAVLSETAKDRGIPVIDLHIFTEQHPEWFPDGVHPNAQGNRQIAKCIYHAFKEDEDVLHWH